MSDPSPSLFAAAAAEAALNGYLALDPEVAERLSGLEGRVMKLEVIGLGIRLYVVPTSTQVRVTAEHEAPPDVVLRGTPFAFAQLTRGEVLGSDIELRGDVALGQRFRNVLQDVEIDWEETLSGVTGDILAHQIGNFVRGFGRWGAQVSETLVQNASEYLQEERRDLPPEVTVNRFLDDVDTLRADVDRLQARVARLSTRLDKGREEA